MSATLKTTLEFIYLYATRGSLESNTAWYFRCIGKPGKEETAKRPILESIFFVTKMADIAPDGIYQLSVNFEVYKQPFMSGAEVIKFITQNCKVLISDQWNGFKTKDGLPVEIRLVAYDKEFKMR